jgi:hypothetical protein
MTTIFNTVEVSTGRVNRIINFLQSSPEFFIAIGKSTPWDSSYGLNISDTNPPFPLESAKQILEPIIYKRIRIGVGSTNIISAAANRAQCLQNTNIPLLSSTSLVEQSPATENFTFFALEDLLNNEGTDYINNPEFIYIQGEITDLDYTTDSWRSSALYTKLFFNTGVPTNLNIYTPDQVKSGLLHHLTYNSPVLRQPGKIHSFEYIINV